MNKELKELQIDDLEGVKILVNEENTPAPARKKEQRFAELLENFWNEGELAEAEQE